REELTLFYTSGAGTPASITMRVPDVVNLLSFGYMTFSDYHCPSDFPGKKQRQHVWSGITSLFCSDHDSARLRMKEFASLTGVRAHPGSYLFKQEKQVPRLGLGSVVVDESERYWLCMQASCDAVRL